MNLLPYHSKEQIPFLQILQFLYSSVQDTDPPDGVPVDFLSTITSKTKSPFTGTPFEAPYTFSTIQILSKFCSGSQKNYLTILFHIVQKNNLFPTTSNLIFIPAFKTRTHQMAFLPTSCHVTKRHLLSLTFQLQMSNVQNSKREEMENKKKQERRVGRNTFRSLSSHLLDYPRN